jgi:glycosylphosphatidylinositol transamidase (GPIT) subunit GPI8
MKHAIGVDFMSNIHSFIDILNNIMDENFPDTKRYIVKGGDFIEGVVMELRQGDQRLKYSPYELFAESEDYENTIEKFIDKWERMLK